jgi:hypothetical protein
MRFACVALTVLSYAHIVRCCSTPGRMQRLLSQRCVIDTCISFTVLYLLLSLLLLTVLNQAGASACGSGSNEGGVFYLDYLCCSNKQVSVGL